MTTEREHYTITASDMGKPNITAFGRSWMVQNFIGTIMEQDVGKRVYAMSDVCGHSTILQVESAEQFLERTRLDGTANKIMRECPACECFFDTNDMEHDQDQKLPDDAKVYCSDCQTRLVIFSDGTSDLIDEVLEQAQYPTVRTDDGEEYLLLIDADQGEKIAKKYWQDMAKYDKEEFCTLLGHDNIVGLATGTIDREQFMDELASEEFGNRHYEGPDIVYLSQEIIDELGFEPVTKFVNER